MSKEDQIDILSKNFIKDSWEMIVDKSCEGRKIELWNLKVKSPMLSRISDNSSFKTINRELERNNILGISFYASFLYNVNAKKSGNHAAVVVGRRWSQNKNSCEYLIRNSWGTNCGQYDKTLDCEAGNVWVPKNVLKKHLQYVDHLKNYN